MGKELRFTETPTLEQLKGLTVNGASFKEGKGLLGESIILDIPEVFRFDTKLEVVHKAATIKCYLVLTQLLTRGPDVWEMENSFSRIGFRDPDIEAQLRSLCDEIIERGLAHWETFEGE